MLQANQQPLNPIPCVEWAYWIKVIKGELMHFGAVQELGYMRKLNVTGIAHSFKLHIYQASSIKQTM